MGLWGSIKGAVFGSKGGGELDKDARILQGEKLGNDVGTFQSQMGNTYGAAQSGLIGLGSRGVPQISPQQGQGFYSQYGGSQILQDPQEQFRQQQGMLGNALTQQALGQGGPSIASMQAQRDRDRAISGIQSAAMSAGGAHSGANLKGMLDAQGQAGLQAAQDAGMMRAQEQMNAQQLAGGLLGNARSQDIGLATDQAGLQQQAGILGQTQRFQGEQSMLDRNQQAGLANADLQMQQQQQVDNMTQYYTNLGMSAQQAALQAQQDIFAIYAGTYSSPGGQQGILGQAIGGGIGGIASGIGQSMMK